MLNYEIFAIIHQFMLKIIIFPVYDIAYLKFSNILTSNLIKSFWRLKAVIEGARLMQKH
jgi:hypothetical protein